MSDDSEKGRSTARLDKTFGEIKGEMKRLGLDGGNARYRNPLDLLEEAYVAIRYPASAKGGASSALLSLRSTINRSIDELVRRLPVEEKSANRRERLLSIGRQCARRGLAPAHFYSLAADDELVNDELSESGKASAAQADAARRFLLGAEFLRALLASVDEAVARP